MTVLAMYFINVEIMQENEANSMHHIFKRVFGLCELQFEVPCLAGHGL